MIRWTSLAALSFLALSAPAAAEWPEWLDPWLHNPEERTRRAIGRTERGAPEDAVEPLDTALMLDPENPVSRYNAGTARLVLGDGGARALLQSAAERAADSGLLSRVHYNLGNVKLAERDYRSAIESYQDALRQDPGLHAAKFNLELARRALEEQQSQPSADDQEEEQEEQEEEQSQEPEPPPRQDQEGEGDEGEREKVQSPLPQFRDLPDMTAEEAAAILEAVENMERARRREDAMEAARANVRGKKDW